MSQRSWVQAPLRADMDKLSIAQMVEQGTVVPWVIGSSPVAEKITFFLLFYHKIMYVDSKERINYNLFLNKSNRTSCHTHFCRIY
jgi:hypothetical protein